MYDQITTADGVKGKVLQVAGRDYKRAKAGTTERHTLAGVLEIPEPEDPNKASL